MRKYRSSKLVQKRRKEFKIKISLILVVLVSLIFTLSQISSLNSLAIKEIKIEGEVQLDELAPYKFVGSMIQGKYLKLFSKRNILIYPKNSIEKGLLETFPRIKILDIDLKLPNNLVVNIIERNPYVLLCKDNILKETNSQQLIANSNEDKPIPTTAPVVAQDIGNKEECYFVDDRGFVFASAPNFSRDILFKFYLNEDKNIRDSVFEVEKFKEIDSFIQLIDGLGLSPYKFRTEDGIKYEIYFGENSFLIFDSSQVIREIMDNFQSILNTDDFAEEKDIWNIDYIDFRFGNKVFYKTR